MTTLFTLVSNAADVITVLDFIARSASWLEAEEQEKLEEAVRATKTKVHHFDSKHLDLPESIYLSLIDEMKAVFTPHRVDLIDKDYEIINLVFQSIFLSLTEHRRKGVLPNYTSILSNALSTSVSYLASLGCFNRWDSKFRSNMPYGDNRDFYVVDAPFTTAALANSMQLGEAAKKSASFEKEYVAESILQRVFLTMWKTPVNIEDARESMSNVLPAEMFGVQHTEIISPLFARIFNGLRGKETTGILGITVFGHVGVHPNGEFYRVTRAYRSPLSVKRITSGSHKYFGNPNAVYIDLNEFLVMFLGIIGDTMLYSRAVRGELEGISRILDFFQRDGYRPSQLHAPKPDTKTIHLLGPGNSTI